MKDIRRYYGRSAAARAALPGRSSAAPGTTATTWRTSPALLRTTYIGRCCVERHSQRRVCRSCQEELGLMRKQALVMGVPHEAGLIWRRCTQLCTMVAYKHLIYVGLSSCSGTTLVGPWDGICKWTDHTESGSGQGAFCQTFGWVEETKPWCIMAMRCSRIGMLEAKPQDEVEQPVGRSRRRSLSLCGRKHG